MFFLEFVCLVGVDFGVDDSGVGVVEEGGFWDSGACWRGLKCGLA